MSAPSGNLETNLTKARDFLERFRGAPLGHFIAGKAERGASREIFDNVSPVDARVINQVISGDEQDVHAAATAAEAAFPAWRAKSGDERRSILHGVANAIEARREEIALVDACVSTMTHVGARALWQPDTISELAVTFAEPDAIGLSSVAGLLHPVGRGVGGWQPRVRGAGSHRAARPTANARLRGVAFAGQSRIAVTLAKCNCRSRATSRTWPAASAGINC